MSYKIRIFCFNRGPKDVLKKRLKDFLKRNYVSYSGTAGHGEVHYSYYLVIDFEATCEKHDYHYQREIIEFPAVLVNAADGEVVGRLFIH